MNKMREAVNELARIRRYRNIDLRIPIVRYYSSELGHDIFCKVKLDPEGRRLLEKLNPRPSRGFARYLRRTKAEKSRKID